MNQLSVLNGSGDTTVTWDGPKVAKGDPEAKQAVEAARRIFAEERAKGSVAFRVEEGQEGEVVTEFDPTATHIVIVPQMAGGA